MKCTARCVSVAAGAALVCADCAALAAYMLLRLFAQERTASADARYPQAYAYAICMRAWLRSRPAKPMQCSVSAPA